MLMIRKVHISLFAVPSGNGFARYLPETSPFLRLSSSSFKASMALSCRGSRPAKPQDIGDNIGRDVFKGRMAIRDPGKKETE